MNMKRSENVRQYRSRRAKKEAMEAYLFLLPFLVGVSIFNVYAFVQNIIISFTNKKSLGQAKFVGLSNYVKLLADAKFYQAIQNTLLYVVICVPAVIILSLIIAVALNQKIKGMGIYRTLIYLPVITLPTAVGMLWKWLFNDQFGLINEMLAGIGINGPAWLSDPKWSLLAVCIVLIWSSIGTAVIIFLSGQRIKENFSPDVRKSVERFIIFLQRLGRWLPDGRRLANISIISLQKQALL